MLILRSLAFNVAFYLNMLAWMVGIVWVFAVPRRTGWQAIVAWSRSNVWLHRVLAGTRVEIRGRENLVPGAIVASKHQSAWETVSLLPLFNEPAFILKRELMWLPVFGWYAAKMKMIPVDRGKGGQALRAMTAHAAAAIAEGRQIIIYPEGTRRAPGAPPSYKYGVVHLYAALDAPVIPVALNSGLYWPRRTFLRHPGTIIVEVLPAIPPGLPPEEMRGRLIASIETATARLLAEAAAGEDAPPLARALQRAAVAPAGTEPAPGRTAATVSEAVSAARSRHSSGS